MKLTLLALTILFVPLTRLAGAQSPVVLRDSAGIRVIEMAETHIGSLPRWSIEGPTVRIGNASGNLNYEFNQAAWPWRLSDGRIVVANDAVELRFYDADGRHLATVGRRGQGPGEYQFLAQIWRAPLDSLRVTDARASRVDMRGPDGRLTRSFSIPRSLVPAWLPDGSALLWYRTRPDLSAVGLQRNDVLFRRMHRDGQAADTVAVLPGGWTDVLPGARWRGVRLAGTPVVSSGTGGAVFIDGDQLAVHWFSTDGRLVTISRVIAPRQRVTNAEVRADARAIASEVARARRLGMGVEGAPSPPRYAEYLPQASDVRLDEDGRAWVRRWTASDGMVEWIVFAPRGSPIARVSLPTNLTPNDVGRDYLLGIEADDDGVQSVVLYHIRR